MLRRQISGYVMPWAWDITFKEKYIQKFKKKLQLHADHVPIVKSSLIKFSVFLYPFAMQIIKFKKKKNFNIEYFNDKKQ